MRIIGLISEDDGKNISLGRFLVWVFGAFSVYFWFFRDASAFPPTLAQAFLISLGYVLGTKSVNAYKTTRMPYDTQYQAPQQTQYTGKQTTVANKQEMTEEDK